MMLTNIVTPFGDLEKGTTLQPTVVYIDWDVG